MSGNFAFVCLPKTPIPEVSIPLARASDHQQPTKYTRTTTLSNLSTKGHATAGVSNTSFHARSPSPPSSATAQPVKSCMVHLSSGRRFSTRRTSILRMDIMIWVGMRVRRRRRSIPYRVKCLVYIAGAPLWVGHTKCLPQLARLTFA